MMQHLRRMAVPCLLFAGSQALAQAPSGTAQETPEKARFSLLSMSNPDCLEFEFLLVPDNGNDKSIVHLVGQGEKQRAAAEAQIAQSTGGLPTLRTESKVPCGWMKNDAGSVYSMPPEPDPGQDAERLKRLIGLARQILTSHNQVVPTLKSPMLFVNKAALRTLPVKSIPVQLPQGPKQVPPMIPKPPVIKP